MKAINSEEFRKNYIRLTEAHEVTANGRVIGTWYPARVVTEGDRFNTQPFTPVPKPGGSKKK